MKVIITILMLSTSFIVSAEERVFYLDDLANKINAGISAKEYCAEKARISVKQAKKPGAPLEAQLQIKKWVEWLVAWI